MDWILFAISMTTFLYIPVVAGRAYQLKRTPRPYSAAWLKHYLHSIEHIRASLWVSGFLLGTNALMFFPAIFTGGTQGHLATIFGLLNLVCAIILYGVWRWAGLLKQRASAK